MGKGMKKLPNFLSHSKSLDPKLSSSDPPWPWPSCGNIKTLSFRSTNPKDDNFRTFNSAFLDSEITPPDSFFTVSSSSRSFSTMSEDSSDPLETVIRGLRSDRLFFEPERSSSLVSMPSPVEEEEEEKGCSPLEEREKKEEEEVEERVAYKESEMLSMESENPYEDFRRSMEEMVEAHGLKDWEGLEELLKCYLKINGKSNHGYIMGAFIDILVSLCFVSFDSSSSPTTIQTTSSSSSLSTNSNYSSPSSPLSLPSSSLTTPCLSSILDHYDDGDDDDDDDVDVGDDEHNDVQHGDDDDNDKHVSS